MFLTICMTLNWRRLQSDKKSYHKKLIIIKYSKYLLMYLRRQRIQTSLAVCF